MNQANGLIRHVHLATFTGDGYGEVRDGALAFRDGRITWVGPERMLPAELHALPTFDGQGGWLTPGLIDCHTHLVYGGNRSHEFEARLEGESYESITRGGGGILSTVHATRAADESELRATALKRLDAMLMQGVTTIEIKSGYGLNLATERRMLEVARSLSRERPVRVITTFLGAHATPPEYTGRNDDYIDHLCKEMLPVLKEEGLVDAVDAFCERIAFSPAQVRRLFAAARDLNLPVKIHAEQLSDLGGASLAAEFGALSADHLEYLDETGIAAMRRAGTVAVLLPGAFYALQEKHMPPVAALRAAGVPIAIATDCNPGSSPLSSPLLAANMACILLGLTPAEALAGLTRVAAQALGLTDCGQLKPGLRADLALWQIERPVDLVYQMGAQPLKCTWLEGVPRSW